MPRTGADHSANIGSSWFAINIVGRTPSFNLAPKGSFMTGEPRFELFVFWRTSATFRVRVALNLKGLTAHEHIVNIDAGEQRDPAFLKINPLGAIPALVIPGHPPMTQSVAILEYLEETAPTPPLLPADPFGRARVRSIASMLTSDTHPFITPRVKRYLFGTGFDDAAWRAWQIHWLTTGLQAVEQRLAAETETGTFCHGDTITMADICLVSITTVLKIFKITVADIPRIESIIARCENEPAFAKADPFKQVGAPQT
jgi:maleylacetoacetate isomerase